MIDDILPSDAKDRLKQEIVALEIQVLPRERNGIPLLRANECSVPVTLTLINELRDQFP